MTVEFEQLTGLAPQGVLLVFAFIVLFVGRKASHRTLSIISLVGIMVSLFLAIDAVTQAGPFTFLHLATARPYGMFHITLFGAFMKLVFGGVVASVVFVSPRYFGKTPNAGEYHALMLVTLMGMYIVADAVDLFMLYVGLEVTGISSFALVAYKKRERKVAEGAAKYFIVGALSSALSLYGISLIYGAYGTTDLVDMSLTVPREGFQNIALLGILMLTTGLGFKISAVPFHMWAPDVYEGAPAPISAMLAGASKKMGLVAMLKIFVIGFAGIRGDWEIMVAVLAVATMTVGNVMALLQKSVKRLVAYSSVAQAGYLLIAIPIVVSVVAASPSDRAVDPAIVGFLYYIVAHSVLVLGIFLAVSHLSREGVSDSFESLKGLRERCPRMAWPLAIFLMGLAGIPATIGFFAKFLLFQAPIFAAVAEDPNTWYWNWKAWLAFAAVANSAIAFYYYLRVIKVMFIEDGPRATVTAKLGDPIVIMVFLMTALVFIFGFLPQGMTMLVDACRESAKYFFTAPLGPG